MARTQLFIALLLCATQIFAAAPQEEEGVLVLTNDNFDETVNNEDTMLVEFYAPWCGHCKKLTPEFSAAAYELRQKPYPVKLAKVDCTVETDLQSRFGVKGYPTLKVFRKGKPFDYSGPREKAGIVSYMEKQAGPSSKALSTSNLVKEFLAHPDISVVGYFPALAGKAFDNFRSVAGVLRENFRFGETSDPETLKARGYDKPTIVVHHKDKDAPEHVFDLEHDEKSFTDWLWSKSVPLVGEFSKNSEERYKKTSHPVLKLFFDVDHVGSPKQVSYWTNRLKKVAKEAGEKLAGKLHLTFANRKDFGADITKLGRDGKDLVLAIEDYAKNLRYVAQSDKIDVATIKEFVTDFLEGKLEPYIKSEAIPEQNSAVKTVVGKNWNDIVMDPTKDVLIELYAPWCGHCKNLEPTYKQLAEKLSDVENVVIAKMDATANDVPHAAYSASGFPTIYFAPANDKENPVKYSGAREIKDFEEFIKRKSTSWVKKSPKTEL